MSNMLIYKTPRNFKKQNIGMFLYEVSDITKGRFNAKSVEDCVIVTSQKKGVDIISLLALYKLLEYAVINRCFSNPEIAISSTPIFTDISAYGFSEIFNRVLKNEAKLDSSYKALKVTQDENSFYIAPHPLLRNEVESKGKTKERYSPIIRNKNYSEKTVEMIATCLSELKGNFMKHALIEDNALLVAQGNDKGTNIAYIDGGDGIISTMSSSPKYTHLKQIDKLNLAFNKNVTSKGKDSYRMGDGLWLISEIVKRTGGSLYAYSEGYVFCINEGKSSIKETGYWKGTIIDIYLPIANPVTLVDLLEINEEFFA